MHGLLYFPLFLAILGIIFLVVAKSGRESGGLGPGETVALDDVTLFSERLLLVGRPDRIVRVGKHFIPEEWKPSAWRVYSGNRLQLGTYFILIEEAYGIRPPHGFVVIRDGERCKVENTEALRSEVLRIAGEIREHRRRLGDVIRVNKPAWKCSKCGQRDNCGQASSQDRHSSGGRWNEKR